jgi:two-component system sensor histidine kinase/response regulator
VHYDEARVLVVDDQPFNRDIVEGLLAAVGISPCLAENGREAIDILSSSRQPFDLVLMDVQMPIMDGLTATRVIRKLEGLAHLPVIAMTAHTMAHERDKSLDAGMDDHIGKPFDETTFYRVLAKWIPLDKQRRPGPSAVRPTPASGLPPLSGVDTRAGLSLLLGDEARYRHWLGEFVAEAPGAMQQIRRALGAGQSESASMTTHTLKGRMGLLGMNGLYVLAAALEAAIDAADASDKLLFDLEQGVGAMCAEIAGALGLRGKSEVAVESLPGLPADLPAGLPPDCVTRLVARLWAGDSDCDMAVAECLAELAESAWAPYLRQALHYVNNFDFAAAGRLLSGGRGEVAVEGS